MENINEALILLSDINMMRYFKYNLEEYCEMVGAILRKVEKETLYLDILNHEGFLPEVIQEQDTFSVYFLKITIPVLIDKCFAMKENKKILDLTAKIIQKVSKVARYWDNCILYYIHIMFLFV